MRLALAGLVLVGAGLVVGATTQLDGSPPEPVAPIELRQTGREPPVTAAEEPPSQRARTGGADPVPVPDPAPAGDEENDDDGEDDDDGGDGDGDDD